MVSLQSGSGSVEETVEFMPMSQRMPTTGLDEFLESGVDLHLSSNSGLGQREVDQVGLVHFGPFQSCIEEDVSDRLNDRVLFSLSDMESFHQISNVES